MAVPVSITPVSMMIPVGWKVKTTACPAGIGRLVLRPRQGPAEPGACKLSTSAMPRLPRLDPPAFRPEGCWVIIPALSSDQCGVVMSSIVKRIAKELGVAEGQVAATVELLDGGATVPFIARYRKEATGSLDDTQLRDLHDRLQYLRDLEDRRSII